MNRNKNKQMELIKLKSFYTTKEIINKMKRQLSQWEIISNAATIKGLISKTFKKLYNAIPEKPKTQSKYDREELNRISSKKTNRWPINT